VAAFLVRMGECQRLLGEHLRLSQMAGQHLRLSQGETAEHLGLYSIGCRRLCQRPREQRHGFSDVPSQGVHRTQGRSRQGEKGREVRVLTDAHGLFEQGEGLRQVALAEGQQADPPRGKHQAARVLNRLGNAEPFFPEGPALGEQTQLGMTRGESGTGLHGGQEGLPEALLAPRPVEGRQSLPDAVNRPTIVALDMVGSTELLVRQRLQDNIPTNHGEHEGTLGGGDGLVIRAHEAERGRHMDRDLSQPTRVIEGCSKGLGLPQSRQDTPRVTRRKECRMQGKPEVAGLLTRGALLRQMREGTQRLLDVPHGLAVGRLRQSLVPCLPAVC
jgi:hypothetical protein